VASNRAAVGGTFAALRITKVSVISEHISPCYPLPKCPASYIISHKEEDHEYKKKKAADLMVTIALFATTALAQADSAPAEAPGEPPQALAEGPWAEHLDDLLEPTVTPEAHHFLDGLPAEVPAGEPTAQDSLVNGLADEAFVSTSSGALLDDVTAVATGSHHSCALLRNGTVRRANQPSNKHSAKLTPDLSLALPTSRKATRDTSAS
jgi:hypothetical protein